MIYVVIAYLIIGVGAAVYVSLPTLNDESYDADFAMIYALSVVTFWPVILCYVIYMKYLKREPSHE